MDYLPSAKFFKTVGTAFGVILGGWLVLYSINRFGFIAKEALLTSQEIASIKAYDLASKDSDNDGLKDWEETIWGTDQQNPDTDGDGTTDEEETQSHRDPTIAGPNDYLPGYEPGSAVANSKTTNALTNQLSNDLLIRYLVTKGLSDGAPLDEEQKNDLNAAFTQDFQKKLADYHKDEFTEKDIIISTRQSPREYINDIGQADITYYKELDVLDLDIFKNAISSNDLSKLNALDPYITAGKKYVAFLMKEEVPANYANIHLELLNLANNFKYGDERMRNFASDPLGAIAGAQYNGSQIIRFADFLKNLKEHMDRDKIIFNKNEPGAYFYKYFPLNN